MAVAVAAGWADQYRIWWLAGPSCCNPSVVVDVVWCRLWVFAVAMLLLPLLPLQDGRSALCACWMLEHQLCVYSAVGVSGDLCSCVV